MGVSPKLLVFKCTYLSLRFSSYLQHEEVSRIGREVIGKEAQGDTNFLSPFTM